MVKDNIPPGGFPQRKIEAREAREKVKVLHEKLRNGISRFVAKDVWGREYALSFDNCCVSCYVSCIGHVVAI